MTKNHIFLLLSLIIIVGGAYLFSTDAKDAFITKTEADVKELHQVKDSTFMLAEEVIKDVVNQKRIDSTKITNLDHMVVKKQITIEQQVIELKRLLYEANIMRELADSERTKSLVMESLSKQASIISQKQKAIADKERQKLLVSVDSLIRLNSDLKLAVDGYEDWFKVQMEEIEILKETINNLTPKRKTPDYQSEPESDSKKKKKG